MVVDRLGEDDIKLALNERMTITLLTCIGWELQCSSSHIAGIASFEGESWERVDIKLATDQERLTMVVVQTYLGRADEGFQYWQ